MPLDFEITSTEDLAVAPQVREARVLVRWSGVPVGILPVPARRGRILAEDVRRRVAEHLHGEIRRELSRRALLTRGNPDGIRLGDFWSEPPPEPAAPLPEITVAVCTRDRPGDLEICLRSLASQVDAVREVLVIDNAPSSDQTRRLLRERFPRFRYIVEEVPGLDHARNRAVREARGEVIAFTDDDVVVDAGWLRALGAAFASDPGLGLVTGLIEPAEQETEAQVWFERYGGFGRGCLRYFAQSRPAAPLPWPLVGAGRLGAGANMAVRREVFDQVGLFDPALDVGTPTLGGGDHEMFFRILRSGWLCAYEPTAVVRHRHRRTMPELSKLLYSYGYATRCFLEREMSDFPADRPAIRRLARWWWRNWALGRWTRSAVCPERFPPHLVWREISGFLAGRGGYRRARRQIVPDESLRPDRFRVERVALRKLGMVEVDVAAPLVDLPEGTECEHLDVLVLRGGEPLGRLRVPTMGRPLSRWRLADGIAQQLGDRLVAAAHVPGAHWSAEFAVELQRHLAGRRGSRARIPAAPEVSVVVATCGRGEALVRCLNSLRSLRYSGQFEILVVDNRPQGGGMTRVLREFPEVRLVSESRRGSSFARNAGVAAARGEVIAMTDDDMVVAPDWLEQLTAHFERDDVMAVTGNTLAASLESPAERDFERYGGFCRGFTRAEFDARWLDKWRWRAAPTWRIGGSGNLAFRKAIFGDPSIGKFDESLGAGVPAGVGEDTLMFYRILRAGGTIVYDPAALARHHHRVSPEKLRSQILAYSKGHVAYHLTTMGRHRDFRGLTRIFAELPASFASRAWARFRGVSSYPMRLLAVEVFGTMCGPWALVRSRRLARNAGGSVRGRALDPAPALEA